MVEHILGVDIDRGAMRYRTCVAWIGAVVVAVTISGSYWEERGRVTLVAVAVMTDIPAATVVVAVPPTAGQTVMKIAAAESVVVVVVVHVVSSPDRVECVPSQPKQYKLAVVVVDCY